MLAILFNGLLLQSELPPPTPVYIDTLWQGTATCEAVSPRCQTEVVQYDGVHLGPNGYRFIISAKDQHGAWVKRDYYDGIYDPDERVWKADMVVNEAPADQFPDWKQLGTIQLIESADGKHLTGTEANMEGVPTRHISLERSEK